MTIADMFEDRVRTTPEVVAIISGTDILTYRELNQSSDKVANALRLKGVGPETVVAVFVERSISVPICLFGILKAGGAYLPLDPSYPSERIRMVLEDAQAPFIVTTRRLLPRLPLVNSRAILIDEETDVSEIAPSDKTPASATDTNLAYLIYTSGSTGRPKGVMVEHRNVLNFFEGMDQTIGKTPGVWLALTSIAFDISVLEILWTLTRGFTVIIHSDDGPEIADEIEKYSVTHLQSTPSLARLLALDPKSLTALSRLKKLLLGGEALPSSLVASIRKVFKGELFNMYGPTETTIWSTTYKIPQSGAMISIGKPILNTQVYILNEDYLPVNSGEMGELYIGGDGVVRGYWDRPDFTAERFLPDPFRPGNRMYRTGDLARLLPDGNLEFQGRVDFQVKIRGFRIELAEIEAALEADPRVRQAVVIDREDRLGDKRLFGYIIARQESPTSATALRSLLKTKFPDPMVPSKFFFVESFPLTANGKIDRNALRIAALPSENAAMLLPRTELEGIIARAWAEALGVDQVGLHENFVDLGAHSLLFPEVHIRIQQELGREISLIDLFEFPTVSSLANHLSGAQVDHSSEDRAKRRLEALKRRGHHL